MRTVILLFALGYGVVTAGCDARNKAATESAPAAAASSSAPLVAPIAPAPIAPAASEPSETGGGRGEGIGLGSTGNPKRLTVHDGTATVTGGLTRELVQRVARTRFTMFRHCYEAGFDRDASLGGRVVVKFTINARGAVERATDGGSDVKDAQVVRCIVDTFAKLEFPEPAADGGVVTGQYSVILTPPTSNR